VIPWQATGGEPRFACDVMTEGLARQLRLCGLDATSAPEVGKNERFKAYRCSVCLPSLVLCRSAWSQRHRRTQAAKADLVWSSV
jgi:uncharacterized protein with PIN domain